MKNPRASNGRSRSASCTRCSNSPSTWPSARATSATTRRWCKAIAATNLDTVVGPDRLERQEICRRSRPRTSPRRRWSAASGGCATATNTTSSSPTTKPRRKFRSAAKWSRSHAKRSRPELVSAGTWATWSGFPESGEYICDRITARAAEQTVERRPGTVRRRRLADMGGARDPEAGQSDEIVRLAQSRR